MLKKATLISATVAAVGAAVIIAPNTAGANILVLGSYSGGTLVKAANNTVTSDLTAASSLQAMGPGQTSSNATAAASVSGLLSTGAVHTSQATEAISGGVQVVSKSTVASVSLLGGAIKVGSVESTNTSKVVQGVFSNTVDTKLVNIAIVGVRLPLTIPKNYVVTIPNLATVILNASWPYVNQEQGVVANAAGIYVSLLKPYGPSQTGAQIWVTPTHTQIANVSGTPNSPVGGLAFGTRVATAVGTTASVVSDPTAALSMPNGGTGGKTVTNTTAGLNLPKVATVGAIYTTANGTVNDSLSNSTMGSEIAGVNLLGGLITADAIKVQATVTRPTGGAVTRSFTTSFTKLVIAGQPITINPTANTVIDIAGIARVTINAQVQTNLAAGVEGLQVVLTTANFGLPVGAVIEVAAARASLLQ